MSYYINIYRYDLIYDTFFIIPILSSKMNVNYYKIILVDIIYLNELNF